MEKISVVIPTYNRANLIERSIRSVLNQTYKNLEVIVVDDGSTDNTEEVVRSIQDERIIYYKQENGGAGMARNTGVSLAGADYVAFHDSDDVFRPEKLEKQMAYMEAHPEYSMVYCNYEHHSTEGVSNIVPRGFNPIGPLEGDMFFTILINNTIGAPTMLFKKACFEEVGGFDTSLRCLEDWEFALRFAECFYIGFLDEVLMDAYQQQGGVSSNGKAFFEVRCRMIGTYKNLLWEHKLFDAVVEDLFNLAKSHNCVEYVKGILARELI